MATMTTGRTGGRLLVSSVERGEGFLMEMFRAEGEHLASTLVVKAERCGISLDDLVGAADRLGIETRYDHRGYGVWVMPPARKGRFGRLVRGLIGKVTGPMAPRPRHAFA